MAETNIFHQIVFYGDHARDFESPLNPKGTLHRIETGVEGREVSST